MKLDPAFAEAYFNRALAYVAKSDSDNALADYRKLIRLDPRTPDDYKDWGRAEDKAARAKAVDRLEDLLQAAKADAQKHSQQGAAFHKAGELDKAIAEYDQALELYPRYAEVYYNRGLAYRQKDDLAKAIADYSGRSGWTPIHSRLCQPGLRLLQAGRFRSRRWPTSTRFWNSIPTTPTPKRVET